MANKKNDAPSDAPHLSNTNSISNTEKTNNHFQLTSC